MRFLRKDVLGLLVSSLPLLFLVAVFVFGLDLGTLGDLTNETDRYLGGTIYLSAKDLTEYDHLGANALLPVIRLGGISERTSIRDLVKNTNGDFLSLSFSDDPFSFFNFFLVFFVLFFAYLAHAMVCRIVYGIREGKEAFLGLEALRVPVFVLCFLAAFFVVFISSFSLYGFKLLLLINFGVFLCFAIPYAAVGHPVGESVYRAADFIRLKIDKVVAVYVASMGFAMLLPVALLIFIFPIMYNLSSEFLTGAMKLLLALFSLVASLFFQSALCGEVVYEYEAEAKHGKP